MNQLSNQTGPRIQITAREISDMLAERIESLCSALGLDGDLIQGDLWPRNPTRADRNAGSFKIDFSGQYRGWWKDFVTDDSGDALDLVAYIMFGGWPITRQAKAEALKWSRRWLGVGDIQAWKPDPQESERMQKARAAMAEATAKAEAMRLDNLSKQRRSAQRMFLEAAELAPGTPGWTYLAEARGLPIDRLDRIPWAVRSHPGMRHVETDQVVPCLISAILWPDGSILAVHRVFLQPKGQGKLKVPTIGMAVKKIFPGGWPGGIIPISRGKTGLSPKLAAERGLQDEQAYAEGVENAFAAALMAPEWRVSATATAGNFKEVEPPECAASVIVCRDNDRNRKTRKAVTDKVDVLRRKCEERGLTFFESWPDRKFKDWNDQLIGKEALW